MREFVHNIASLIKVKTIVTIVVISVFAFLAVTDRISGETSMTIVSSVVSFYFGTAHERMTKAGSVEGGRNDTPT